MVNITSISLIIGYFFMMFLCSFIFIYIFKNRKNYGTELIAFLISLAIFNSGFIFSSLYICSVVFFFSLEINLLIWKVAIISEFITLTILIIIYSFSKEYKKVPIRPIILLSILYGLLIGSFIVPNSVMIEYTTMIPSSITIIDPGKIHYHFNLFTTIVIILFHSFITVYFLYVSIVIYRRERKKERSVPLLLNSFIFLNPVIMFAVYLIIQLTIFRELYIILLWITLFGLFIMLVKLPEMFFILPNEIYYINIYHKSGILLFSYDFGKKLDYDPVLWGNTLIGLNHILSEFIEKTDKIDVIQTKNTDLVVKYDDNYGYAVILITNKKNSIIEALIEQFSKHFKNQFIQELSEIRDLNRIINVSEFKAANEIVEQIFELYL